jgi:hypothetical protein
MPTESVEYLRKQAAKCRNLASSTLDERVAKTLKAMADEYEQKASEADKSPTSSVEL